MSENTENKVSNHRFRIEGPSREDGGPVVGAGTRVFMDGEELDGITRISTTFEQDRLCAVDMSIRGATVLEMTARLNLAFTALETTPDVLGDWMREALENADMVPRDKFGDDSGSPKELAIEFLTILANRLP